MLTKKQEAFAQAVASGEQLIDAYIIAGYSTKASKKSQYELASRWANKVNVKSRIEEIKKEHEERSRRIADEEERERRKKIEWTKEKALIGLQTILQHCMTDIKDAGIQRGNANSAIQAIDKLNLLEGLYDLESKDMQDLIETMKERNEILRNA